MNFSLVVPRKMSFSPITPMDSNGSQPHGLDGRSTREQDWSFSSKTFNSGHFEESHDTTTTNREQICYTAEDLDARRRQPVVLRGAGSQVTHGLDNLTSSQSHFFVSSSPVVKSGNSAQVEIHLTESETQWLSEEADTQQENVGVALVQESPEVIELKKKVACMQSEIAKAKLTENQLNVHLAEKGQENVFLRERLGIGNSSKGVQSTGSDSIDKNSNKSLRKNDAPRGLASGVSDLKQVANILQDIQQRLSSLESQKVNEAQGMRPDPYPLGAAIDYLGKRPATFSDPHPELDDMGDRLQDQEEESSEQEGDRILGHEESDG